MVRIGHSRPGGDREVFRLFALQTAALLPLLPPHASGAPPSRVSLDQLQAGDPPADRTGAGVPGDGPNRKGARDPPGLALRGNRRDLRPSRVQRPGKGGPGASGPHGALRIRARRHLPGRAGRRRGPGHGGRGPSVQVRGEDGQVQSLPGGEAGLGGEGAEDPQGGQGGPAGQPGLRQPEQRLPLHRARRPERGGPPGDQGPEGLGQSAEHVPPGRPPEDDHLLPEQEGARGHEAVQ